MTSASEKAIVGCLLGQAVGDAVGLCAENLSPGRVARLFPELDGPRLLLGRGMCSDDTEHVCMVGQALLASGGEPRRFARSLGWRLRGWLLGAPAGIGWATLRAILKLWLGFPPWRSGVWSAGNGPAMRSTLLGVMFGNNPQQLRELIRASTRITHTDPRAEHGALAVALAAHLSATAPEIVPAFYLQQLTELLQGEGSQTLELIQQAAESAAGGESALDFATRLGSRRGVSGFILHTVPALLHVWFRRSNDYPAAIREMAACGGDTDTTAAILGGIIGARVGKEGIPQHWRQSILEWPRTLTWMERLGRRLAEGIPGKPLRLFWPGLLPRNLFFFFVVLLHACRRLLPPY